MVALASPFAVPDAPDPFYAALMAGADAPTRLADLLDRPPWMLDALCRERPGVNFYPVRGESSSPARAVCRDCLVRRECLVDAVEHAENDGVWAGTSAKQRRHAVREGWDAERLLYEIDTRTGPAGDDDEPAAKMGPPVAPVFVAMREPVNDPAKRACSSCEELIPLAELVHEHWCRTCW